MIFCTLLAALIWTGALVSDRKLLSNSLIRLHVVANSDSLEDQSIKLQVRDAILTSFQEELDRASDMEAAVDHFTFK